MFGIFCFLIFQMLWPALALTVATLVMFGIWMWPKPMKGELSVLRFTRRLITGKPRASGPSKTIAVYMRCTR